MRNGIGSKELASNRFESELELVVNKIVKACVACKPLGMFWMCSVLCIISVLMHIEFKV